MISNFIDIKRDMLDLLEKDAYENVHGSTDSEHLAALYMTLLTKNAGGGRKSWEQKYSVSAMKDALASTFKTIIELQRKTLGPEKAEANSLNVCVGDGEQMVAFRFRNHKVEQPPSLYWSNTAGEACSLHLPFRPFSDRLTYLSAGVTLNRKYPDHPDRKENKAACKPEHEHGVHMIIASEPTTYKVKQWNVIDKNHAVLVSSDGKYSIESLDLADEHFATAKTTQPG